MEDAPANFDPIDEALVIRHGGAGRFLEKTLQQAQDELDRVGTGEVSVWCVVPGEQETRDEAIFRVCLECGLRYKRIRVARAGDLRAHGFLLVRRADEPPCHYNVVLATVTEAEVGRLLDLFDQEEVNPAWEALPRRG